MKAEARRHSPPCPGPTWFSKYAYWRSTATELKDRPSLIVSRVGSVTIVT